MKTKKWCVKEEEIQKITKDYFHMLFKSQRLHHNQTIFEAVEAKVTKEMNCTFIVEFTLEEIHEAIKQMHPTKAPGSDSLLALFYQKYWYIVGKHVISFCLKCINGEKSLKFLNSTNIVLIPKVKDTNRITHFCPISLCNVIYKIIAKVLANKLKHVVPSYINES